MTTDLTGEAAIFYHTDPTDDGEMESSAPLLGVEGAISYVQILTPNTADDSKDEIFACDPMGKEDGCATRCSATYCMNRYLPAAQAEWRNCHKVVDCMRQKGMEIREENALQHLNGEEGCVKTLMVMIAPVMEMAKTRR